MLVNFVSFAVAISLLTIKRNNDIIRFAKIEKRDIMSEYWLIPMDFLVCNFDKLQKEYRKNFLYVILINYKKSIGKTEKSCGRFPENLRKHNRALA